MSYEKLGVNYAKEYGVELEQVYPYVLHFGALYAAPNNGRYRFTGTKTIEIPSLEVGGRKDANRDTIGNKARRWNNNYTPLTLRNERYFETLVHPKDIGDTKGVAAISNITQVFNNEQKFPEMDAYCVSRLYADWTALGRIPDGIKLTINNILGTFDSLMERMTENRVPASGRILYVTPAVDTLLKSAAGISRTLDIKDASPAVQRAISYLDSVTIEVVPSDLMKTAYDFTDGWAIGASAKQIQMFLVHPNAVITPTAYEFAQLDPPSAGSGGKYDYYEESHEDVFILPRKEVAIEYVIEEVALGTLAFTSAAGTATGDTKITVTTPQTEGSYYAYKVKATNDIVLPGYSANLDAGWIEWDGEDDITAENGSYIAIVEVNGVDKKAIKGGSKTVTAKV